MVVRPGKKKIRLVHRPASGGLGAVDSTADLPDVFEFAGPQRRLAELVDAVTNELDAYSRWLGRNPAGQGSLAAAALLPADLVDLSAGPVGQLRDWVNGRLGQHAHVLIDGTDLIARWPSTSQQKLTKADAVSVAQLLSHMGVGIEPDVRFGPMPISTGPAILFRLDGVSPAAPTPDYQAVATLLHLAVVVGYADGELAPAEYEQMATHLEEGLGLSAGEKTRMRAHLQWLVAARVTTAGIKKRLAPIAAVDRQRIADFLLSIVTADGVVHPAEVSTLVNIYKLLGLDPTVVHHHLHSRITKSARPRPARPATGPVVVRPATTAAPGFALPRPYSAEPESPAGAETVITGGGLILDEDVIADRIAESAKVSALLATIFSEEELTTPRPSTAVHNPADQGSIAVKAAPRLSDDHTALLQELAGSATWSRRDFDVLAEKHGLLAGGALDVINEAALELADDLVLEGNEELTVNADVILEMLK
jgi:uncharacterized tellurite resistance protein B-like protein